MVTGSGIVW